MVAMCGLTCVDAEVVSSPVKAGPVHWALSLPHPAGRHACQVAQLLPQGQDEGPELQQVVQQRPASNAHQRLQNSMLCSASLQESTWSGLLCTLCTSQSPAATFIFWSDAVSS